MKSGLAVPAVGAAQGGAVPLREKFFGCIAGCHIGSSIPANDLGKYCDYAGLVSMARS